MTASHPNFVSYERLGAWDTLLNTWKFTGFKTNYIERPFWLADGTPDYWETYAHNMQCNESFWYVQ